MQCIHAYRDEILSQLPDETICVKNDLHSLWKKGLSLIVHNPEHADH